MSTLAFEALSVQHQFVIKFIFKCFIRISFTRMLEQMINISSKRKRIQFSLNDNLSNVLSQNNSI